MSSITKIWLSIWPALLLTLSGCAELMNASGIYSQQQYYTVQQRPSAVAQHQRLAPVDRGQTGQSYNRAKAQLLAWTEEERERRISSYLQTHERTGSFQVRETIKANLITFDREIAKFEESQSILGTTSTSSARYSQLKQGRSKCKADLDAFDENIVQKMLEDQAASSARLTSYSTKERQSINAAGANAARAAQDATIRANSAFNNTNW